MNYSERKDIYVKDGYCYQTRGIQMIPSIVFNSKGEVIAGKQWLEDIIKEGKERPLQVIQMDELLEYRRDNTEPWRKHPQRSNPSY